MNVLSRAEKRAMLTALKAAAGPLDAVEMRLYQNDVAPTQDSVAGDFTVADFGGYADEAITWGAVASLDSGDAVTVGNVCQFDASGVAPTNIIYGYTINVIAGGALVYAERFAEPVEMGALGDTIAIVPRYKFSDPGIGAANVEL